MTIFLKDFKDLEGNSSRQISKLAEFTVNKILGFKQRTVPCLPPLLKKLALYGVLMYNDIIIKIYHDIIMKRYSEIFSLKGGNVVWQRCIMIMMRIYPYLKEKK